jgi:2,3-bisphosphoglycerate-independent phosphoglycerate mutase
MAKYLVLLGDGMADEPLEMLDGRTPLEVAEKPNMDRLAREGICGWVKTVPERMPPGSDVANLSVLGFNPETYYTGRAPLEAASMGVDMGISDVAYRCNLVTVKDGIMVDYSAGHISSEEAARLVGDLGDVLGDEEFSFYPGVSYRHLLLWEKGIDGVQTTPPHDISGRPVVDYLPKGEGADRLRELMARSEEVLCQHPVNVERMREGKKPATMIWLWGQGRKPALPSFYETYGLRGGVISAVDLMKGMAVLLGMEPIHVSGATGYLDTNYQGKAQAALDFLRHRGDLVYLHVEAPDEAGHQGDVEAKIKAIEDIDTFILPPILEEAGKGVEPFNLLLLCDHPTPISLRTHTADPVPFVIWRSHESWAGEDGYGEASLAHIRPYVINQGYRLMSLFTGHICRSCGACE